MATLATRADTPRPETDTAHEFGNNSLFTAAAWRLLEPHEKVQAGDQWSRGPALPWHEFMGQIGTGFPVEAYRKNHGQSIQIRRLRDDVFDCPRCHRSLVYSPGDRMQIDYQNITQSGTVPYGSLMVHCRRDQIEATLSGLLADAPHGMVLRGVRHSPGRAISDHDRHRIKEREEAARRSKILNGVRFTND